jgi:hypothetical protein
MLIFIIPALQNDSAIIKKLTFDLQHNTIAPRFGMNIGKYELKQGGKL